MPEKCTKCQKKVRSNQHAVSCDTCSRWTHRTCDTGISRELYYQLCSGEENIEFFCHLCGIPQDASSIPGTPLAESSHLSLHVPALETPSCIVRDVLDDEPIPNNTNIDFTVAIPFEEPHEDHER